MTPDDHAERGFQYLDDAEALLADLDPQQLVERRDAAVARAGHYASMATAHFLAARTMGRQ